MQAQDSGIFVKISGVTGRLWVGVRGDSVLGATSSPGTGFRGLEFRAIEVYRFNPWLEGGYYQPQQCPVLIPCSSIL